MKWFHNKWEQPIWRVAPSRYGIVICLGRHDFGVFWGSPPLPKDNCK